MQKAVKFILFIFMALNLFSCNTVKVDWQPGINAPKYYPARIVSGGYSNGKDFCAIASGTNQYNGWGKRRGEGRSIKKEDKVTQ